MGIQSLPPDTVETLGACQVLNDPVAVVKELLDNSYDAKATSIAIEISSNTIDSIQARDTGHGIPAEDRNLVARPHCTSKINNEDHLRIIGGSSLGFRGEALASIAALSGSLTISTRVEGEEVATALKINLQGEVEARDRASLPVGTTIKIVDFFKYHPVRKQMAPKNAEKSLKHLKALLRSYAFARPNVRLSLKVLKAKTNGGNWVYAPKTGAVPGQVAADLAIKIVGAACASQCTWSVIDDQGYGIQAYLPTSDADVTKISNIGSFLSVDGRPVSVSRGTPKEIIKLYREMLKKSSSSLGSVKDPFIYLKITCPVASYDANIEPAKDNVLFCDPEIVLSTARKVFEAMYHPNNNATTENYSGDTLPAPQASHTLETPAPNGLTEPERQPQDSHHAFRSSMYGYDEEDLNLIDDRPRSSHTENEIEEIRQARNDVKLSNPWIMAKLNAPAKPRGPTQDQHSTSIPTPEAAGLPTPGPSSPEPPRSSFHPSDNVPTGRLAEDGRVIGSQKLPPPQMLISQPLPHSERHEDNHQEPSRQQGPNYDYTLSSQREASTAETFSRDVRATSSVKDRCQRKSIYPQDHFTRPRAPNRALRPPRDTAALVVQGELGDLVDDPCPLPRPAHNRDMRDFVTPVDLTADDSAAALIEARNYPEPRRTQSHNITNELPAESHDMDVAASVGRSGARGFIPASEIAALEAHIGSIVRNDGGENKRRKTNEGRVLREISSNSAGASANVNPELDQSTSRTPSHRCSTAGGSKAKRIKSSQLPLERTPVGQCVQNLVSPTNTTAQKIAGLAGKIDEDLSIPNWDREAMDMYNTFAEEPSMETTKSWTNRLYSLLRSTVSNGEVVQDLGVLIHRALEAHGSNGV